MSPINRAGRLSPLGLILLAVTSVGWGLNFPIMKHLLTEWPPLSSRGLCGIAGAVCARAAAEIERAAADVAAVDAGLDADDRRLGRVHGAGTVVAQCQRGRGARPIDPGLGGVPGL